MAKNKVFTYMVIHDVKHPTTSLISVLKNMSTELFTVQECLQEDVIKESYNMREVLNNQRAPPE